MIGIHDSPGSFSDRWVKYCTAKDIPFRRVDCLSTDVIAQCEGLDALLWHWAHNNPVDQLVARQIIASLTAKVPVVFPDVNTCWHYDDKIAQKYLLEAIGAPVISTWVFTRKIEALRWIEGATWPKVFKLRGGAGSTNVSLVRSRHQATALCLQAFGRGFPAVAVNRTSNLTSYLAGMPSRVRKTNSAHELWQRLARVPQTLTRLLGLRPTMQRERGYVYFQEFLPNNAFDTRITVIGNRAFGFRRMNRPDDFRASGSGNISHEPDRIDKKCVAIAFRVANQLGTQSLAFDFLFNPQQEPMIGEISYCYAASAVQACRGYWDQQGTWHEGNVWPEHAILEDVLTSVRCPVPAANRLFPVNAPTP